MATLTEMVAAVVVHSSAAAFSHFGVTLEAPRVERPAQPAAQGRRQDREDLDLPRRGQGPALPRLTGHAGRSFLERRDIPPDFGRITRSPVSVCLLRG